MLWGKVNHGFDGGVLAPPIRRVEIAGKKAVKGRKSGGPLLGGCEPFQLNGWCRWERVFPAIELKPGVGKMVESIRRAFRMAVSGSPQYVVIGGSSCLPICMA